MTTRPFFEFLNLQNFSYHISNQSVRKNREPLDFSQDVEKDLNLIQEIINKFNNLKS